MQLLERIREMCNGADPVALQRLLDKCRVNDETGCLEWCGGMGGRRKETPIFHFPGSRQDKRSMPSYKALWLMCGKQINPGRSVYRGCLNVRCVNPEHCKTGTHAQMGAHVAKSGKHKGDPRRQLAARTNATYQRTPETVVRRIEELLASGMRRKDIAATVGVCGETVTAVKQRRHFHCSTRPKTVRGASVFAL